MIDTNEIAEDVVPHGLKGKPSNNIRGGEAYSKRLQIPVTETMKDEAAKLAIILNDDGTAALVRRLLAREIKRHRARISDT